MKILFTTLMCFLSSWLFAHEIDDVYMSTKQGFITPEDRTTEASLRLMKDQMNEHYHLTQYALPVLTINHPSYISKKYKQTNVVHPTALFKPLVFAFDMPSLLKQNRWLLLWFVTLLTIYVYSRQKRH